jgi:predicted DCC family thiol-disulfide oxidoreductase YuxK
VTPDRHVAEVSAGPVLLYDGACGFCSRTVRFVLRHDGQRTLRFAPLQSPYAARVIARHAELTDLDSLMWVEAAGGGGPERVLVRSAAALSVAAYLGGWWRPLLAAWLVPLPLRDAAYDLVARHRHQLFGASDRCFVPPPEARARFLDAASASHDSAARGATPS